MDKIIFISCLLFIFSIQNADSRPVDKGKAKQVALNWIFEKSGRKLDAPGLTIAFIEKVDSENIYYVLNYPQGGWIIISADDIANPVITFSYKGTYSTQGHPIQFDQWMENVKTQIHAAIGKKNAPSPKTKKEWDRLNVVPAQFTTPTLLPSSTAPLLTTTWNQGRYYNASCPEASSGPDGHVWAGCVATAMGQVMKYHNHPSKGSGTHSYVDNSYGTQSADFGMTTYNWTSMPDSLLDYNEDIATLLYHVGVSVEMDYGTSGSGAYLNGINRYALQTYFKYSDSIYFAGKSQYSTDEWLTLLHTELNNNRPVLYQGEGTGGHAFVCDGYMGDADDYFHFNWGWGGYLDGYFYLNDLTPGSRNYTNSQGTLIGVMPAEDPHLLYPYFESFEEGIPADLAMAGSLVSIVTDDFHSGANSLRLSTPDTRGSWETRYNRAILNINVPVEGAQLSFWVKRGYDPAASPYSQQKASLKTQFGNTTLYTFYSGDFNDSQWQQLSVDLLPYAGSNIKLVVTQYHNSTTYYQWTYLDDVEITTTFTTCFEDLDQDGYGSGNIIADDGDDVCETETGESTVSTDCNDSDASIYPNAIEVCDSKDNNCDSQIDENGVCSKGFWLLMLPSILNAGGNSQ